jgi:hypothetical protein
MLRWDPNAATTRDFPSAPHEKADSAIRSSSSTLLDLSDTSWSALARAFQITDAEDVRAFLAAHPAVVDLLFEIRREARRYFGDTPMGLEIFRDPEWEGDEPELFVVIQTHLGPHEALERLHQFDREWWLAQRKTSGAPVVVTVDLI